MRQDKCFAVSLTDLLINGAAKDAANAVQVKETLHSHEEIRCSHDRLALLAGFGSTLLHTYNTAPIMANMRSIRSHVGFSGFSRSIVKYLSKKADHDKYLSKEVYKGSRQVLEQTKKP